ncbi:MAG: hypothetical protein OK439_05005, partial [Thaumarchaeota archaeon]|nr:hypothetical protein [Nitrososphaerota archaeon]
ATDTAVLCGIYPRVAQRKYLGLPIRTDYSHEVGMRLIFGLLALTAMRYEASITPLFSHHDMHYFRAYSLVEIGNRYSRENETKIGYVLHCFKCGFRKIVSQIDFYADLKTNLECMDCDNKEMKLAGPLWIGEIQSKDFIANCAKLSELSIFDPELDIPLYYDLTAMTDLIGTRTPKIADVISGLRSIGHSASRTRLNPAAVRTDAPRGDLQRVLLELVR